MFAYRRRASRALVPLYVGMPRLPPQRPHPTVKCRTLGRTTLRLSELGFGAMAIGDGAGGIGYGPTDDALSVRAVHASLDRGCTFFDTADFFGAGHSELVLGRALRRASHAHPIVVATSVGGPAHAPASGTGFSPAHLSEALDASLRRLGRDHVDLYQLCNPPCGITTEDSIFQALEQFRAAGKIRYYGVTLRRWRDALHWIESGCVHSVQIAYNVLVAAYAGPSLRAVFDAARLRSVGLIAREPLANGFLAGPRKRSTTYHDSDVRASITPLERKLREALATTFMAQISGNLTAAQAALRFVLDERAFATVIVGIKSPVQAAENFRSVDLA
jgi:aryl-alcohol dehydrogenase-like predicted oxidoreductase